MTITFPNEQKKLKALLQDDVWNVLKENGAIIAGGAITSLFCNREVNDVDVYLPSYEALQKVIKAVYCLGDDALLSPYSLAVQFYTKKSVLLIDRETEQQVQLIHFNFFNSTEEIFKTFDFTCCMGAYECKTDTFVLHEDFLKHNSQRYLKFWEGTAFPLMSALRVDKYKEKGYSISKAEYLRVLMSCMSLKIDSWEALGEHIGGMYGVPVEDVFETKIPFSLEEGMRQLSNLHSLEKFKTLDTSPQAVLEYIAKAHKKEHEVKYLKAVKKDMYTGELSSFCRPDFKYKVGEVVNGGVNGVWYQNEWNIYNSPYYNSTDSVIIELKPLEGASVESDVIKGDVFVVGLYDD